MRALLGKRPSAIRDPIGAAGLACVQKRIIHAGRQRHRDLVALGVQRVRRDGHHAVMEGRLRRGRNVRERERRSIGFADQQRVAPVEARGLRAVDPVRGGRRGRARLPRQRDGANAQRRHVRQERRGRSLADQDVIEIPAVHHDRGVRYHAEPQPHGRLIGVRGQIELLACPTGCCPGVVRKTDPRGAAVHRNLDMRPIIRRLQRVPVVEPQRGPHRRREV